MTIDLNALESDACLNCGSVIVKYKSSWYHRLVSEPGVRIGSSFCEPTRATPMAGRKLVEGDPS
jgi:hypothetical protein